MKKIILIAGIFSFGCAAAQSNDLFDPKEYLEKQTPKFLQKQDTFFVARPNRLTASDLLPNKQEAKTTYHLSNGNKVTILPQSNMPCIVPDMQQYNMPNVATTNKYKAEMYERYADKPTMPGTSNSILQLQKGKADK